MRLGERDEKNCSVTHHPVALLKESGGASSNGRYSFLPFKTRLCVCQIGHDLSVKEYLSVTL